MKISLKSCSYSEIEKLVISNNRELSSPIDSFAEMHILKSNHYTILLDDEVIGYCSVYNGKTVTQFYITKEYRAYSQEVFSIVRKVEFVSEALIPTCDEFFLSLGFDNYSNIKKQAYFFQFSHKRDYISALNVQYRLADISDLELIRENSEDFFDETLEKQIKDKEIYIGFDNSKPVAFGIYEKGGILQHCVSIGMYTVPEYRTKGVGKQTLNFLIEEALNKDLNPIAGCWYYNHLSKKTLESVGMISNTRYLRFIF